MEESPVVHPSEKTLSFYGLGKLDDHQAEAVNRHLKDCAACQGKSGNPCQGKSGVSRLCRLAAPGMMKMKLGFGSLWLEAGVG